MNIVKLHATRSTNEELKFRFRESELPHLTTIYTLEQTHGKGQQGNTWHTEKGKNLIFSVLCTEYPVVSTPFLISKVVSVSIVEWLKSELQIQAKIKWPNDILSVQHKLAGILIENTYQGEMLSHSIIGIGLNVNQEVFEQLPKAISLKLISGREYDIDYLLISFLKHLERNLRDPVQTAQNYHSHLYKYQQSTSFMTHEKKFQGIVKGTTEDGKLLLEVNEVIEQYDLKELQWIY